MRKRVSLSTTLALIILSIALTISITMMLAMRHFNNQLQLVSQRQAMYTHVNEVDKVVREYYPNLDEELLRQGISKGYIDGLNDPYAAYYAPVRYTAEQLRMSGKANNIGITLTLDEQARPVVGRVQKASAAGKAGVAVGDVVTAVDGEPVEGKSLAELQALIGSAEKVLITVSRGEESHGFDLSAFEYTVRSVESATLGNVGYIRISAFYKNTPSQFKSAVSALQEKGVTGIVFDLRNNAGGSPEAVNEVLSYIMPLGTYGTMTDVKGNVTKLNNTSGSQVSLSIATLVNGGTAGEAEFFAGVLQDASLSIVVGQTTAGKAKYQEYFPLNSDQSALKLTTGEYGLVKSGSWQDVGIVPAVETELPPEQASISMLLSAEEDAQVQVALEQISSSDMPEPEATTTTTEETTKKTTEKATEATKEESKDKTEETTKAASEESEE